MRISTAVIHKFQSFGVRAVQIGILIECNTHISMQFHKKKFNFNS